MLVISMSGLIREAHERRPMLRQEAMTLISLVAVEGLGPD